MNLYNKLTELFIYVAICSMLIQPVAQAKTQAQLTSFVGVQAAANMQKNPLNAKSLLNSASSKTSSKTSSKQVKVEKTDEEQLSKLSQDIYWKLKDWKTSRINQSLSQDDKRIVQKWITDINQYHQKVMTNMNQLTAWIDEKKLSDTIVERQQQAIIKINQEVAGLKQHLNNLNMSTSAVNANARINQSFDFFAGKQLKRKHQVFDGLSSVALTPDRIEPATKAADFAKYKFPAKQKTAVNKAIDYSDPALLGTSDEVVINDYITAKATELDNDPVKIYHWVRNNIEWLPSHGAIQASDITLGSSRGNAFDQSSLLIALLRAANVPSRYAYGTIEVEVDKFTNWVGLSNPQAAIQFAQYGGIPLAPVIEGGVITKVQMEHIWVEAAIDFNPSRGAKNITPDSWVSLDPSFKQHVIISGINADVLINDQNMDLVLENFMTSGTYNNNEGWVQNVQQNILDDSKLEMETQYLQYISDNISNPNSSTVTGGRNTIIKEYTVFPASTELKIVSKAIEFAEIPDSLRPKYRIAFSKDILGNIEDPLELSFSELNNHKLTLSFKPATSEDEQALVNLIPEDDYTNIPTSIPAHLIQVVPVVSLDEEIVKEGTSMFLGYDLSLHFQLELSSGHQFANEYSLPAGSYVNLILGAGSVSQNTLKQKKLKLEATMDILNSSDPNDYNLLSSEKILGDMFHSSSLSLITQFDFYNSIMSKQFSSVFNLSPIFGSVGFEPNVNYLFGTPISTSGGGVGFNVYSTRQIASNDNLQSTFKTYNLFSGFILSKLESFVLSQDYVNEYNQVESVSSMSLLKKAINSGQKIFSLTSSNIDQVSNLNLHSETVSEITESIQAGYTVLTHETSISVDGWVGEGYIILNPFTGDASYKITGGSNGGHIPWYEQIVLGIALVTLFALLALATAAVILLTAALIVPLILGVIAYFSQIVAGLLILDGLIGFVNDFNQVTEQCGSFTSFAYIPFFFIKNLVGPSGRNAIDDILIWLFGDPILDPTPDDAEWC